jgi:pimeloyl-ACP methyl ester carboxylesterase
LIEGVAVIPFQRQAAAHEPERVASLENLELLRCGPQSGRSPPLLFVHGAFAGAWCWAEHFMPHFAQAGYDCYALSLRGHGQSDGRGQIATHSVRQYVDDLEEAIKHIGTAPVVIGHSMGGFVAQKYLERQALPAMALIASVPPHGLVPASMSLALLKPQLLNELNGLLFTGRASMDAMRQALFAGPIAVDRLSRYYRLTQPESPRVIWDMSFFDLPQLWRIHMPPLLVLGAERDVMVPPQQVELCAQTYGTRAQIFPGMGHAMMLDAGWQEVADRIIGWLDGL